LTHTPKGLILEGAAWSSDKLVLNDGESVRLTSSQIHWVQADGSSDSPTADGIKMVNLPVYLNKDRQDVLFTVDLPLDAAVGSLVSMRAVCLTAGG
jgi:dynein heavy chain 1, cytosolic